jgi:hypothetical protein
MALANEIQHLAKLSLDALDASHDYFAFTEGIWQLVGQHITGG